MTTGGQTIIKSTPAENVPPNLRDYSQARAAYSWEAARRELDGLPGGRGLNIAHEAVDRHAAGPRKDRVALRWLARDGPVEDFTYGQLQRLTSRFANVLRSLGVARGDRVYALAGRIPALYVAALGTLKNRSVFCPLFSAFGPEPIRARMAIGQARVLVTTVSLYPRCGPRSPPSSMCCSSTIGPRASRVRETTTRSWPKPTSGSSSSRPLPRT